jgi:adenylate cyclase
MSWLRTAAAGLLPLLMAAIILFVEPQTYVNLREAALGAVSQLHQPPGSGSVAVVEIDAESSAALGNWPWPRKEIARLIDAIAASGAKTLAVDMVLGGRCGEPGNAELAAALARTPSTIGFVLPGAETEIDAVSSIILQPPVDIPQIWQSAGAEMPCPEFAEASQGLGTISLAGDASARISAIPALVAIGETPFPGLAADAVRIWTDSAAIMVSGGTAPRVKIGSLSGHVDETGSLRLAAQSPFQWSKRTISAKRLIETPQPLLEGKLVFLGTSLPQLGTLRPTAADPLVPSVQIHADIAESLLTGTMPWRPRAAALIELAVTCLGTVLIIIASVTLRPLAAAMATLLLAGAAALGAILGQTLAGIVLDPVLPALALAAAGTTTGISQYSASRRSEAAMRHSFEQRLPASIVAQLSKGDGKGRIAGEERIVTALFTDIEGFTVMTAAIPPKELVRLLDGYFAGVAQIVSAHGGFIDKIVGDAAHAFFNMPEHLSNHEGKALDCASALLAFSESYREKPDARAAGFGRTRMGIETGPAVVGDIGAAGKFDYSAHGSAVNLAARLQDANKITGTSILAGPGIVAARPPGWKFESLGFLDLRGFGGIEVFSPTKSSQSESDTR